jgi:hypothetical protein
MTEETGTWVYAVTGGSSTAMPDVAGVGGTPLRAVAAAGLVAVVSAVDLAEYGEEPLRGNLENLEWLEATARAHHDVIDAVAEAGPVVPMQLATVYRGEDRVAAMLAERRDDFQAVLERIRGRVEWGIKVYVPDPAGAAVPTAGSGSERPGAAYLQRRRSELSAREDARAAAASSAEEIHAELAGLAAAATLHKPQHSQLTGRPEPMILNGAYLVDYERASAFSAAAYDLAGRRSAVRLELTGPWPPYSFTQPSDEDPVSEPGSISA